MSVDSVLYRHWKARAEKAEAEAEALRAALEGLVRKMAAHSGSCCTFDDDGTVRVTRESCKCGPVERAAHEAIDWYGTTWKRGTRPTGSGATPAPAAPAEQGCSTCIGQDEACRECGGAPAPAASAEPERCATCHEPRGEEPHHGPAYFYFHPFQPEPER